MGRNAMFNTPEDAEVLIEKYFESLEYEDENEMKRTAPATITGLAMALGFCSRQSMYDYEKKALFTYTIKTARLRVENSYEQHLFGKSAGGAIFGLKNMGWSDKQEIDTIHKFVGSPRITFDDK